jgi:hypothetical protein
MQGAANNTQDKHRDDFLSCPKESSKTQLEMTSPARTLMQVPTNAAGKDGTKNVLKPKT